MKTNDASMEGLRAELFGMMLGNGMSHAQYEIVSGMLSKRIPALLKEAEERFRKALDDNENETLWGDEESNEVMKISIKEYKEAVLQSLTEPSK